MATFMNKALTYLGLKDIEDDELYDDYEDDSAPLRGHTVYPDGDVTQEREQRFVGATVRPLVSDDARDSLPSQPANLRPLITHRATTARVHVVAPSVFGEAQEIGDLVKQSSPVIVNLQLSERDLARRMIDFCSGLTYALGGAMEKVADQVFLLTPSNVEVSAEERMRLQERGLFHSDHS